MKPIFDPDTNPGLLNALTNLEVNHLTADDVTG